ncbi:molybdopterin-dependent oxidoreductase [Paracoccus sp. FO-3]|jgi:DMSO/TMAO reductase YedYZ molybdopterin-dependent catalytic subunit|uniref:molybdopterin-dependent oxidoreductase n=1 Tax=Paracoccaceae TaxID=31989 RepID=UPI00112C8048|nr:molybdopterin-dependent oxidoreductase [Paracoccus sp. FO-3]HQU67347.1 molybdopterin-dependent oxidoreductase [Albidovulum sp.]
MTEYLKDGRPRLPPNQVVTQKFPVMTAGTPTTAGKEIWSLTLDGDVAQPVALDWQGLMALPQQEFIVDIHCVTRWSKLDTRWRGVSVTLLADLVGPRPEATYVQARADGSYSANLRLADLLEDKAFVATEYEGQPLAEDHGGPARLVVPGLYFWKSAKWLRGLHFSPFDYKGYWEKLGYHNYGDPWKEQRYRE